MKSIPTAKELMEKNWSNYHWDRAAAEAFAIEFAKLHVEAALKTAAENAKAKENPADYGTGEIWVDRKSILSAYPLSNIK